MGAQEEYVELLSLIVDCRDHAVAVSSDSENDAIAGDGACRRVAFGYLPGHLPLRAFDFAEPSLQSAAGVGMFLPESEKSTLEQNAQCRSNVPLYTFIISVPNINDCTSYLRGCQDPKPSGCSSFLGLERSGEECAAAVGDIVYLLLERHRAGTRPAPTGPGRWKGESTRDGGQGARVGSSQRLRLPRLVLLPPKPLLRWDLRSFPWDTALLRRTLKVSVQPVPTG